MDNTRCLFIIVNIFCDMFKINTGKWRSRLGSFTEKSLYFYSRKCKTYATRCEKGIYKCVCRTR
ncbi:hypothetical protein NQ317_015904 [Molorchus minor]|uniref:Uncharacterized protein n=1 Tax=Molorchus minor TaxID=1323400 RepID=A0ABQ9JCW9_9CUCU|nr:hypothetical protein NQ317_015904 [Molorchus minor]